MLFPYKLNQAVPRADLHKALGGNIRSGIVPCRPTPNILLFAGESGPRYGYVDGWQSDGCYHYTGEGTVGDQVMERGNKAVLNHEASGRALRLFDGSGGVVTYLGEFTIDKQRPYYRAVAPDINKQSRQVIRFRLHRRPKTVT